MDKEIEERIRDSKELLVGIGMVVFVALMRVLFLPSMRIGLLVLFLLPIAYLIVLRFTFNLSKNLFECEHRKIEISKVFKLSSYLFVLLSFLPIIGPIWAIVNFSKKLFKEYTPLAYKFLKITTFLYSIKTQKEIFEPIIVDWQEEYFEALFIKEIWKARWINVRYTYAFLAAMWQKSPIGDLIEFVVKIAKG